jgi:hypothetical protein
VELEEGGHLARHEVGTVVADEGSGLPYTIEEGSEAREDDLGCVGPCWEGPAESRVVVDDALGVLGGGALCGRSEYDGVDRLKGIRCIGYLQGLE